MLKKESFFVTGGPVGSNSPSYVERQADADLYRALRQGTFCYVLTPRQMGKSSLVVRTRARLRGEGLAVAVVDLTFIGQSASAEQWYRSILRIVGEQLGLEDKVMEFWRGHADIGALDRLMQALEKIVLPGLKAAPAVESGREELEQSLVIFIDEVDYVRSLPFPTGEFFAAVRALHNKRTINDRLENLTFCLLGVASLSDLIEDARTTPFNIGEQIELTDFTEQEATPLIQGLRRGDEAGAAILRRVLHWTGGHPFLTQRLCEAVADDPDARGADDVDRVCGSLFLSNNARISDKNLVFVRDSILKADADRASLLDIYERVHRQTYIVSRFGNYFSNIAARAYWFLRGYTQVRDDETNPLVTVLRLSGITQVVGDQLAVRNRIYYHVFDREWIHANTPGQEKERQRAAFIRGALRIGAAAAVILLVVSGLALAAYRGRQEAVRQGQIAESRRFEAEQHQQEAVRQGQIAESRRSEAEQQRQLAEQEKKEIEQQRDEIQWQKDRADKALKEAERQRNIARLALGREVVARRAAEAGAAEARRQQQIAQAALASEAAAKKVVERERDEADQEKAKAVAAEESAEAAQAVAQRKAEEAKNRADVEERYRKAYDLATNGRPKEALAEFEQTLGVYQRIPDPSGEASTLRRMGEIYGKLGDADAQPGKPTNTEQAIDRFNAAIKIYDTTRDLQGKANSLKSIASVYEKKQPRDHESVKTAVQYYAQAADIHSVGNQAEAASEYLKAGELSHLDGDESNADGYFKKIFSFYGNGSTSAELTSAIRDIGGIYLRELESLDPRLTGKQQDPIRKLKVKELSQKADSYFNQAIDKFQGKDPHAEALTHRDLGGVYYYAGNKIGALNHYKQALTLMGENGDQVEVAGILYGLAYLYEELGDKQLAYDYYSKALPIYSQTDRTIVRFLQQKLDALAKQLKKK